MTQHYSAEDENGTEFHLQTYPGSAHIRFVVIPRSGATNGAVYFMPWTAFQEFASGFQEAHDTAKQNDGDREVKEFFKEIAGQLPLDDRAAREVYEKAERWFKEKRN